EHSVCRFRINIERVSKNVGGKAHRHTPTVPVTARVLDQLPRRVTDATGTPGDMINFLIVGSQKSVEAAFRAAGWTGVDRNPEDAALHVVLASIGKRTYTEMPMSDLYLFGRVQDYGFARAKP